MEFEATVLGEHYTFSPLTKESFLITGRQAEYILYKKGSWRCADNIGQALVEKLGQAIEEHLQPAHH